jgi:aconitate hydratase
MPSPEDVGRTSAGRTIVRSSSASDAGRAFVASAVRPEGRPADSTHTARGVAGSRGTLTAALLERNAVAVSPTSRERTDDEGDGLVLRIEQALLQDSTGGSVLLGFEGMGIDRVRIPVAVQYVDHQVVPDLTPPPDDLVAQNVRWLESASARFGLWFSQPGHGVSHVVHAERFGRPGVVLVGSDSHTCMAGALGMFGIGLGGLDLALALAGEPLRLARPAVRRIHLVGRAPVGVSPRDVGLALLARFGVDGNDGHVLEFVGPGLDHLDVPARMLIAGLCAQTGAVTSVMPSDAVVREFLARHGREDVWEPLFADADAVADDDVELDLCIIEPLIARPSSPGDVVPIGVMAGQPVVQAYLGSSGSATFAEYATAAAVVAGRRVAPGVRFDVNLPSERIARALDVAGLLDVLRDAGATLHATGCDEFTRDTQAPPPHQLSVRSVNRNFPGRSGTSGDRVVLASSASVAAAAVTGVLCDPRELADLTSLADEPSVTIDRRLLIAPLDTESARRTPLVRGANIVALPRFEPLPDELDLPVLLVLGDDVSTETIIPGTPDAARLRTNIDLLASMTLRSVDPTYAARARATPEGHALLAGWNHGHGSSREQAALAPRRLGARAVLAGHFSRIHGRNLANYGVLPLEPDVAATDELAAARRERTPWGDLATGIAPTGLRVRLTRLHTLQGDRPTLSAQLVRPDGSVTELSLHIPLEAWQIAVILRGGVLTVQERDAEERGVDDDPTGTN